MATTNDITGDVIATKANSPKYVNRFDWAFCKNPRHLANSYTEGVNECSSCGMKSVHEYHHGEYRVRIVC